MVGFDAGAVHGAEGGREQRVRGADTGEAALEQVADGAGDGLDVILVDPGGGLLLEVEEPPARCSATGNVVLDGDACLLSDDRATGVRRSSRQLW